MQKTLTLMLQEMAMKMLFKILLPNRTNPALVSARRATTTTASKMTGPTAASSTVKSHLATSRVMGAATASSTKVIITIAKGAKVEVAMAVNAATTMEMTEVTAAMEAMAANRPIIKIATMVATEMAAARVAIITIETEVIEDITTIDGTIIITVASKHTKNSTKTR